MTASVAAALWQTCPSFGDVFMLAGGQKLACRHHHVRLGERACFPMSGDWVSYGKNAILYTVCGRLQQDTPFVLGRKALGQRCMASLHRDVHVSPGKCLLWVTEGIHRA